MATPSRRRRLIIEESPSSFSSFFGEDSRSTCSSDDDDSYAGKQNYPFTDSLTGSMSQLRLSNDASTKKQVSKSRSCQRGGIGSLTFESGSEDSDSSMEAYVPTFKPQVSRPIVDSDASESEGDTLINVEDPDDDAPEDDTSTGKWSYNTDRGEFSIASTIETKMPRLTVPKALFNKLFDYQKDGVVWMAGLHNQRIGGLLGDDMGLGKTFQTLTLLGGLMRAKTIRNALVVAPLSVLRSWEREAHNVAKACAPDMRIQVVSSETAKPARLRRLQDAMQW